MHFHRLLVVVVGTILILCANCNCSKAQLSLASNFGSYPTLHNPAYTGVNTAPTLWAFTRQQWINPQYDLSLIGTNCFGVELFIDPFHIGIGAHVEQERLNEGFSRTSLSLQSSIVNQWFNNTFVTAGLSIGHSFLQKNDGLTFIDQYQRNGFILPNSADKLAMPNEFNRTQTTFGFGFLVEHLSELGTENNEQWGWQLAGSTKSIPFSQVSTSFPGSLPLYFSLYGSTRKGLNKQFGDLIGYNLLFQNYGEVRQFTTGISYYRGGITLGLKYRGGLLTQNNKRDIRESIIANLGVITTPNLKLGFSWDQPFASGLKNGTIGSLEFSILYVFGKFGASLGGGAKNSINLKRISSNKKETKCKRPGLKKRKMYYLWPDR